MAEIQWIKLSVNMFDDEKIKLIRTMPEGNNIVLFWIQLLCLAGKINDGGMVYFGQNLAYSDEMLSTILGTPLNIVRSGLKTLDQFGMIEISDDGLIDITNWEKHQNIEGMERVKDGNAERQRVSYYRKKLKAMGINPFQEGIPTKSNALKAFVNELESKNLTLGLTLANRPEEDKNREEKKREEKNKTTTSVVEDEQSQLQSVLHFYQNNFGVLSNYIQSDLMQWCSDLSPELAIKAMQIAQENQKSYNYAKGIMQNWLTKGIKTLDDVAAEQKQFQNRKVPYNRKQKKDEIKPYWTKDTADTEQASQQTVVDSGEDILSEFRSLIDEFKDDSKEE
ncbi:phage replisome organizer N-terminal domain-containing protein [Globicatella sanguinis]|uniref:phage replisome organizer N-terminal domain-containing protein n=1 Tax=Globicatella sanguinis TaxID=13076 RepID=UPI000825B5E1|nr:phage replisome organizer N-terminal domain-containing protein [Globicatella sanguinis]